jgi:hypothetical protein
MGSLGRLLPLVAADFRERTRRYSFLITLLGTVFFGFLVITGKWVLRLGEYRGEYNSAWVGSLMASASACMLAFFGFYLVKNALSRDRQSRVGEILATTPLSNALYIFSKFVSNFAVLAVMAATLVVAALVMQLLGSAEAPLDPWALVAPFLFICLPVLTLVAAAAVLFESIRFLRGTLGNIVYFFAAELALVNSFLLDNPVLDFSGLGLFIPSMEAAARAAYPGAELGLQMGFVGVVPGAASFETMKLFHWDGIEWSLGMVPLRLLWVGAAMSLTLLATRFFDRFDPARSRGPKSARQAERSGKSEAGPQEPSPRRLDWGEVTPVKLGFSLPRMWLAEVRLMVQGLHLSWYLIALALFIVQLTVPYEHARSFALPAAWVWPLAMWSSMGAREARFNTGQLVFSSAFPGARQFPAMWLAGLAVAALTASPMLVRALLAGEGGHLSALLAATLFVPTLALFLGVVSGTKKLFEMSYLMLWYLGAVNHLPAVDFLGVTDGSVAGGIPQAYLILSLALLAGAFLIRRRQLVAGMI